MACVINPANTNGSQHTVIVDAGCISSRDAGNWAMYHNFTITDPPASGSGSAPVPMYDVEILLRSITQSTAIKNLYATLLGNTITGAVITSHLGVTTATVSFTVPAGDYSFEGNMPPVLPASGSGSGSASGSASGSSPPSGTLRYSVTITPAGAGSGSGSASGSGSGPTCVEGVGPGDNFCISEINGPGGRQIFDVAAVSHGNPGTFNSTNAGFSTEATEILNLTNPNSYESFWLSVENIPNNGWTFQFDVSAYPNLRIEVYDQSTLIRDIATLALADEKNVTGQGTGTITLEFGTSVDPNTYNDKALLRIFTVTDLTGGAFTVDGEVLATIIDENLSDGMELSEVLNTEFEANLTLSDNVEFSDQNRIEGGDTFALLVDSLNLTGEVDIQLTRVYTFQDFIEFADSADLVWYELITESAIFSDSSTFLHERINRLIDGIKFSDDLSSHNISIVNLAEMLTLFDLAQRFETATLSDTMELSNSVIESVQAYNKLIDDLIFYGDLRQGTLLLLLSDTVQFSDAVDTTAEFAELLRDDINFVGALAIEGEEFFAYVINTQSTGISKYENYGFNSFSYPYAAASDGIYKLDDADDDDGEAIDANIRTGLYDFGTSLKKQVPTAYLGLTDTDRILLKTIMTERGVKKERLYEVRATNVAVDTTRGNLGKGVKGKYWQFDISNIEGEYFELESTEIIKINLKRRKQ